MNLFPICEMTLHNNIAEDDFDRKITLLPNKDSKNIDKNILVTMNSCNEYDEYETETDFDIVTPTTSTKSSSNNINLASDNRHLLCAVSGTLTPTIMLRTQCADEYRLLQPGYLSVMKRTLAQSQATAIVNTASAAALSQSITRKNLAFGILRRSLTPQFSKTSFLQKQQNNFTRFRRVKTPPTVITRTPTALLNGNNNSLSNNLCGKQTITIIRTLKPIKGNQEQQQQQQQRQLPKNTMLMTLSTATPITAATEEPRTQSSITLPHLIIGNNKNQRMSEQQQQIITSAIQTKKTVPTSHTSTLFEDILNKNENNINETGLTTVSLAALASTSNNKMSTININNCFRSTATTVSVATSAPILRQLFTFKNTELKLPQTLTQKKPTIVSLKTENETITKASSKTSVLYDALVLDTLNDNEEMQIEPMKDSSENCNLSAKSTENTEVLRCYNKKYPLRVISTSDVRMIDSLVARKAASNSQNVLAKGNRTMLLITEAATAAAAATGGNGFLRKTNLPPRIWKHKKINGISSNMTTTHSLRTPISFISKIMLNKSAGLSPVSGSQITVVPAAVTALFNPSNQSQQHSNHSHPLLPSYASFSKAGTVVVAVDASDGQNCYLNDSNLTTNNKNITTSTITAITNVNSNSISVTNNAIAFTTSTSTTLTTATITSNIISSASKVTQSTSININSTSTVINTTASNLVAGIISHQANELPWNHLKLFIFKQGQRI